MKNTVLWTIVDEKKKIKSTEMQTQQLPIWKLIFEQSVPGIFAFTAILANNGNHSFAI